jgi:hypothetical protein
MSSSILVLITFALVTGSILLGYAWFYRRSLRDVDRGGAPGGSRQDLGASFGLLHVGLDIGITLFANHGDQSLLTSG